MKSLKDNCHSNIATQIMCLPPYLQEIIIEKTTEEIEKKCKDNVLKQIKKDLSFVLGDIIYDSINCYKKGIMYKCNYNKYRHLYSDDIINILEYISNELIDEITFLFENNNIDIYTDDSDDNLSE